jgi:hypothetical protein
MYVDTGDWIGWIYVEQKPWIYSLALSKHIFMPETNVTESGGWAYVPK